MDQLRILIREELKNILKERRQHADDEIIQFDDIDLQHEFNILNSLLFNSSLKPVPMVWKNTKSKDGSVYSKLNRITDEYEIQYLAMSKYLKIPYRFFKDNLAHEMIHVKFMQEGDVKEGHGWKFQREMNRINSMGLGFNVKITNEELDNFEISDHIIKKTKELVVIIMDSNKIKNMLCVVSPEIFESEWHNVERLYNNLILRGNYSWVKGVAIKSSDPLLLKYPKKRSLSKGYSYVNVNDNTVLKLIESGKIIKEFKFPTE